jgi:hypothetical protein
LRFGVDYSPLRFVFNRARTKIAIVALVILLPVAVLLTSSKARSAVTPNGFFHGIAF